MTYERFSDDAIKVKPVTFVNVPLRRMKLKYRNVKTACPLGNVHASKAEAIRCQDLHTLQKAGVISDLVAHPQPVYPLIVNGKLVCKYIADFRYTHEGKTVVEDVKGVRTREYAIKAKLFEALFGVKIHETRKDRSRRGL